MYFKLSMWHLFYGIYILGHASINLANFLCKMREEADKIGMTAKLLFQKQALKKLNKNAESKQRQVTLQWEAYNRADNPLSSRKLLFDLGKVTSKHSKSELREVIGGGGGGRF